MTRLWDKGAPLDARVLAYTAGEDHLLDERLVRYDIRASIAHAQMLRRTGTADAGGPRRDPRRADGASATNMRAASGTSTLDQEDCQTAIENLLTARIGAAGGRLHAGRSRNDQVLAALRLYLRDAARALHAGAIAVAEALDALARARGHVALPGYTHMQQAMPSTVALWAQGSRPRSVTMREGLKQRAAPHRQEPARLGRGLRHARTLPLDRESTRRRLGFAVTQEPVTAVQLSRGKAEAQLLFEITLLTQDLGRLAADLLLFYTQEFGFVEPARRVHDGLVDHAAEAQPGRVRAGARRAAPSRRRR